VRDVLRRPGLRLLLAGETTSMFGDWVLLLVLAIWIKTLTGSNSLAGAVMLAIAAPSLVSPLFGWGVDRFRRRPFLIAANLSAAASLSPLLLVNTRRDVWLIFMVAVFYGVMASVTGGAFAGLLKELVPDDLLGSANGLFASVRQSLRLCGPLVGAGLFAATSGKVVALVDIASFLVAAAALAGIRVTETPPVRAAVHWLDEVSAGVRHVFTAPALRRATVAFGVGLLALGAVDTMIFAYVDHGLHRAPTFIGVLVAVQGVGTVAGALAAPRAMAKLGEVTVVAVGLLAFGVAIGIAVKPSLILAFIAMPFAGVGNAAASVAFGTLLQRRTPGPLMGRVSAAADMVLGGAMTLSMAAGAALIAVADYRPIFAVISAVLIACGLLLWRAGGDDERPDPVPAMAPVEPIVLVELVV
jgi:MFS family permease